VAFVNSPVHPYFEGQHPLALAHRGFSLDGLENSMAAFEAAVDLGFQYIETDVHATADGVLIAFHDDTLERVTDMTGRVAQLPWDTVRQARIGGKQPIPRLDDLFGAWPDVRINIDVKVDEAVGPLANAIERAQAHHRVCVASFSDARRRDVVKRLSAPVATSGGTNSVALLRFGGRLARPALRDVDCFQVPERHGRWPLVTSTTVREAHAIGKQVHVWTVNDAADMRRLLNLGVDGIVTDRADVLRDVLAERAS
jgi:glycerophosphoryl diester phosphodiesterase